MALLCLQVSYVENLYRDYIKQKVSLTQDALELAITKELHLRNREQNRESSQFRLYIKAASDMTPQERDSLWHSTSPGDTLNLDSEWNKNIGKTRGEILQQWLQDKKIEEGNGLQLATLDSLYSLEPIGGNYRHVLLLYDADKRLIASAGELQPDEKGHCSEMTGQIGDFDVCLSETSVVHADTFGSDCGDCIALSGIPTNRNTAERRFAAEKGE